MTLALSISLLLCAALVVEVYHLKKDLALAEQCYYTATLDFNRTQKWYNDALAENKRLLALLPQRDKHGKFKAKEYFRVECDLDDVAEIHRRAIKD